MRHVKRFSVVACSTLALLVLAQAYMENANAQEKKKKSAAAQTERKTTKKSRGRLPAYYGQIGLSNQQREKIYTVQAKYKDQLDELRKQIAAIEEKRDGEVQAVLTADQKKELDGLLEKARNRKRSTGKKRESGATSQPKKASK